MSAGVNGVAVKQGGVSIGVVAEDLDDEFRICFEQGCTGPDFDVEASADAALDGDRAGMSLKRSVGSTPDWIEFAMGGAQPSFRRGIVAEAVVAIEPDQ